MPETVPFSGLDEMIARIMRIPTRSKSAHIALALVGMLVLCVAAGDPSESSKAPQRIIATSPSNTEIICALGAADRLVAVSSYATHPPEILKLPKIGGLFDPDMESILALAPDLRYDPDNRRLRFRAEALKNEPLDQYARPRKVSHVVLNSGDMEGVADWYCRTLGFRVSDYSADQMIFLRCASDHHSIALVRGHYPSVNHVAFELPSINEYMRSIGRMREKGIVPTWGPGRHGPGDNPFAYFVSPSGYVIEFTSEIQQIDEATHEAKVWPRDVPEAMDQWMTAGPPTAAQRAVMQGRPDPGFAELRGK